MTLLSSILYGVIQGIAEFLPVSSSGHLALAQNFHIFSSDGAGSDVTFNVVLHMGTLAAVVLLYRKDVLSLIKGFFSLIARPFKRKKGSLDCNERLFLQIALPSVLLIPGALLEDTVTAVSGSSTAIGVLLIINGAMLFVSEKLSSGTITLENAGFLRTLAVGAFQLFGILPGISRSGATVTGALFCGFERKDALRFSFLMSIPAVAGAGLLKLKDAFASPSPDGMCIYLAGALTAAAVGAAAIKLLQYLAKNKSFLPFAAYCLIVGAAAVIYELFAA